MSASNPTMDRGYAIVLSRKAERSKHAAAASGVRAHEYETAILNLKPTIIQNEASADGKTPRQDRVVASIRPSVLGSRPAQEWQQLLYHQALLIREYVDSDNYPRQPPTVDAINQLIIRLVSISGDARRLCLIGGMLGNSAVNQAIERAVRFLGSWEGTVGTYSYWVALRSLCASLCFYWAIAGAVSRGDFEAVKHLMHAPIGEPSRKRMAVTALPLLALGSIDWTVVKGFEQQSAPASDFMFRLFQVEAEDAGIGHPQIEDLFDTVEFLITAEFAHIHLSGAPEAFRCRWFWAPLGRSIEKQGPGGMCQRLADHADLRADDPVLRAGLLGGTPASAAAAVAAVRFSIDRRRQAAASRSAAASSHDQRKPSCSYR
jgi:hypothetical protein